MTQVGLSGLVLTVAASGLVASAVGDPDHGVTGEFEGGVVTYVVPGSPSWRDGIRPFQRVIELAEADSPGGWRIMTTDGEVTRGSFGATHADVLRLYIWWALPATVFAGFVALLGYRKHRGAAALLPIALAVAAQPLLAVGRVEVTLAVGIAIFFGGALSVGAFRESRRWSGLVVGAGLALATIWAIAILAATGVFDAIDGLRAPVAVGFGLIGLAGTVGRRQVASFLTDREGGGFVDLAYLAAAVGLLGALAILGGVPLPLLIGAGLIGLTTYPSWRRKTLSGLEGFLTAPARREAAILAVESERGRLAREIHDAPLQELTAVIRRLESMPGAGGEATVLRDVAAQLRDVATALHPPVLQDLGLSAAIADLADQLASSRPDRRIHVSVDDLTGGDRPPGEVELAAFRVIQEACANSLAHSDGHQLKIQGAVSSDSVEFTVGDDGTGIDGAYARTARRGGHFGLDSMRERAEIVGALCAVTSDSTGVTVTFQWVRSA